MKIKDRLDEIEAQLDHITNRIDNLRDKFVTYIKEENKIVEPKLEGEVREIVRHWANLHGYNCLSVVFIKRGSERIFSVASPDATRSIEFSGAYLADNFDDGRYTIDELCGEEEE